MSNVLNFFEQPVDGEDNALQLGGTVKQGDGTQAAAIADPAGGGTVDAEARAAIVSLLTVMRNTGFIQP